MEFWYLIYTKPKKEILAKEHLERQGYLVYLPMATMRRRTRSGKLIDIEEAMFPRYLFINLNHETDNWAPIRSTIGVVSLVRFGSEPARIPQSLIDVFVARENEEGLHELPLQRFLSGQKVLITEGLFEGYEAIFTSYEADERVSLFLDLTEKLVKIKLKQYDIKSL